MIKICAISDLHGHFIDIDKCDLLLICGDSVALGKQSGEHKAIKWYRNQFQHWIDTLPCEKVLFIAGNHDPLESCIETMRSTFSMYDKATYLCDESYIYTKGEQSIKIYGTPWCKIFGNWHFMSNDECLEKVYYKIPNDLDILITHDVPYGFSDVILQSMPWNTGEHLGNIPLFDAIRRTQPKYHISGHLHSANREWIDIGKTKHINASILDEQYQPVYEPIYFEI
jgi:Icc-related predicted phosphoesterase